MLQPITEAIEPSKQSARRHYGNHPYFTRLPYNIAQRYIEHFSEEGEWVLDPFSGSGTVAIESLVLKRRSIAMDINPLAVFMTENNARPWDIDKLEEGLRFISQDKDLLRYSQMDEVAYHREKVPFWYPEWVVLPFSSDVKYVHDLHTRKQLIVLSALLHVINKIQDEDLRDVMRFIFSATLVTTNRMFRQRSCTPFLQHRYWIPPKPETEDIWMQDVWQRFTARYENFKKSREEINELVGCVDGSNLRCYKLSATRISEKVDEESVDYILTDIPLGDRIQYLDLSILWNSWLDFEVTDDDYHEEMVEGGRLKKSKKEYGQLMRRALAQMYRALKSEKWMTLVLRGAWNSESLREFLIRASEEEGFRYINTVEQSSRDGDFILNFYKP
ncbi:MAG: DNA methyltransferase [bacterium]